MLTVAKKMKTLAIGKYKISRCFQHIKSFNSKYTHNKKSWMTGSLFENYLYDLDRKKKKILLFIKQCITHTAFNLNLKNLRLEFFCTK